MPSGKWAKRFAFVSVINLFIGIGWTATFLFGGKYGLPDLHIGPVISGGSAGMWFTMAYLMFLIVGVLGTLFFAAMYHLLPEIVGADSTNELLSWLNFVLVNIGVWLASFVLGYWGYRAGVMQHVEGLETGEIHPWLVQIVDPMGVFIAITCLGMLMGAINLTLAFRKKSRNQIKP